MTTGSVLAQFTITLSKAVSEPVAVEWHTADGTAHAGVDYAASKGTVLFAPGETTKTVDILVYGRAVGSDSRSFFVEMMPPTNAILGASIGECIINVDTTGSTPVTQIIVPTGPRGLQGDSAYQEWLNLGNTGTEQDFINSLKPSPAEIAQEVAPLINLSNSTLTAEDTETLSKPDTITGKRLARKVAYVNSAKVATVILAAGDNLITHADLSGDAVDFNSISLYPRILRGDVILSPEWSVEPGDKILIKNASAGDIMYICQYDVVSEWAVKHALMTALDLFGELRSISTVAETATGKWPVGKLLELSDRGGATFKVNSTGTPDGYWVLNAGAGKVAELVVDNNEINSSSLGISDGQDVTAIIIAIAQKIKANNVTSVKMLVDASFSGVLPFEYNRVAFGGCSLTGKGRLAINNASNIIQALPNARSPYKVYTGKLNGMLLDNQNTKSAIEVRKEIRVVLLGDSIGVTSDWDSKAVSAGQRMIQGVDNFSTVNAFGFLLFQEICAAVGAGVRVKFYSRCVGGKSYVNLGAAWDSPALNAPWSGREQCTAGKAWVNCVLDLEPDLVIHEMGMNHGAADYLDSFVTYWYSKLYETGRMGTFDQALVTTPSPNFEDAGAFGDFRQFCTPMFYVAQQQRYVANKYGMSLIDVSFLSFLKRYGIDTRSVVMSKDYMSVTIDGANSVNISAGSGKSFQHPNNPIFHQTTLTINQNAGSALDFRVNFGDGVIVQFGKTSISIITGFFSSMSTSKTVAYSMPDNTDVTFTVQVLPHGVFVYAGNNGDTLLLVNDITAYTTTVGGVMQNSSATGSVTVKDVKVFEGEFPRYASDTSTIEMYGVLDYTQNPFGGGINHPSNKGLAEIYIPPVREFCTRMTEGNHGNYINNQLDMSNNDLIYIGSVETLPYSVSEFWDDTALSYLKIKYSSIGALQSIENRTGMPIYYNARGDIYAKISGGRKVKGMRFSGCWRKFGGWVVNAAHAPLRLTGFTEVPANFSTTIETFTNGKITRIDVAEISSGTTYDFPLDFTPNLFIGAMATISVDSDTPQLAQLADTVQVTSSSSSGKLHYHCTFSSDAAVTPRRIMFESTYILK